MENTKTQETISPKVLGAPILLNALYWVWDAFDRANVSFFLVHQTYEDAKRNRELTGDKVEIGVRRVEWQSGGRRILDAFLGEPITETDDEVSYLYSTVPVIFHIYKDSECIVSPDTIRYRYEEFKVPNPYSKFVELYG